MEDSPQGKGLRCSMPLEALNSYRGPLEAALLGREHDGKLVDDVLHACCCVSGIIGWELSKEERCDLLYYLAGAIIYGKLEDTSSFDSIMSELPRILNTLIGIEECDIKQENGGERLFAEMKGVGGAYTSDPEDVRRDGGEHGTISCVRYADYLKNIAEAYETIQGRCKIPGSIVNCEEIRKGYRQNSPQVLYDAMYKGVLPPGPTFVLPRGNQGTGETKLYSEWIYDMLKYGGHEPTGGGKLIMSSSSLSTLPHYTALTSYLGTMESAWNLISKIMEADAADSTICTWFYFWLGHMLFEECALSSISDVISKIYEQLGAPADENKCSLLDNHNSKDAFLRGKKKFDYKKDYKPEWTKLQTYYKSCHESYAWKPEDIPSTFHNVNDKCSKNGDSDPYCDKFQKTYKDFCTWESTGLKCKDVSEVETTERHGDRGELSSQVEETHATVADTPKNILAISGTISTVGLGFISLLVYKYTSLFSEIKNSFGGNRSRKRSVREDLNELSSDSSTDYSTTVGSSSNLTTAHTSTIADTTDVSTIYNGGRPTSRGRSNNRRGENRNRNIRYQRI